MALVCVLVVLIGIRGALFVADLAGPVATPGPGTATVAPPVRSVVDVPSILRANLFGQAPPAAGSAAPITSMRLVLTGVFASNDEKQGFALIGSNPTDVQLKKVGDPVPGGASLHAVHVDRVLLSRGGAIETLPLPALATMSFAQAAPPPPQVMGPTISMGRVEQALRSNPGIIGQVMHRTPVFSDGRLRGMRVSAGPNAEAFSRLGLRNNDLVTAINGVELNDEARSRDVFDSLSAAAEARLTVERNGATEEIVLNLAEIASEAEQIANAPPPDPNMPTDEIAGPSAESLR